MVWRLSDAARAAWLAEAAACGLDDGGEPPERVSSLVQELGLPSRLREVEVPEEDLEAIAGEYGDGAGEALAILTAAY